MFACNILFVSLCLLKVANAFDLSTTQQLQKVLKKVDNPGLVTSDNGDILLKIAHLIMELALKQETACKNCCQNGEKCHPVVQCKDGFTLIGQNCYHVISKHHTWVEALKACRSLGATLAEPKDAEGEKLLINYISANYPIVLGAPTQIWIGGSRSNKIETWLWASTNTKIQRMNWGPNEPNYENENCISYAFNSGSINWNNAPCDLKIRAICQQ